MACHGARRLLPMTENLFAIVGIEALAGAQGVEMRAPLTTGPELQKAIACLRAAVPPLEDDRYMADDLAAASELVAGGALVASVSPDLLPALEV
jgi:histidine ammonia-lyase